jgi:hypothetical protein
MSDFDPAKVRISATLALYACGGKETVSLLAQSDPFIALSDKVLVSKYMGSEAEASSPSQHTINLISTHISFGCDLLAL